MWCDVAACFAHSSFSRTWIHRDHNRKGFIYQKTNYSHCHSLTPPLHRHITCWKNVAFPLLTALFTRLSLPSNQASHGWKIQIHNFSVRCVIFSHSTYLSHASTLLYVSELSFVVVSCRLFPFSRELPHSYNCELLSLWCVSLWLLFFLPSSFFPIRDTTQSITHICMEMRVAVGMVAWSVSPKKMRLVKISCEQSSS